MSHTIMLIPTSTSVGLTSVSLGIIHSIEQRGVGVTLFEPITQSNVDDKNQIIEPLNLYSGAHIIEPLKMCYVESMLANNQKDILMEKIIANYYSNNKQQTGVTLIKGLTPTQEHYFANSLNYDIAKILGAEIIFITTLDNNNPLEKLKRHIKLVSMEFGNIQNKSIIGVIINKLNVPVSKQACIRSNSLEIFNELTTTASVNIDNKTLIDNCLLPILGCIPWNFDLVANRVIDIAYHLNATIINQGELQTRRIKSVIFCSGNVQNIIELFNSGSLLVISSDRYDVIISACLAAVNGIKIGALLLTGTHPITKTIHESCQLAFKTGLPVLMVNTNTWQTSLNLQNFSLKLYSNDHEKIEKTKNYVASYINKKWINSLTINSELPKKQRLSPPVFRYQLTELACRVNKRIVLPEGNEPRTIKAAAICAKKGIATCVLLGDPNEIKLIANAQGVELGARIEIISPKFVRKDYIKRLVELRKDKGITEIIANEQLKDNVVLGTMMLEKNEVDGLVSGAVHTTANTIRPSLQLIKTAPGNSIVSSIFFMLLPEEVLIYADCAINPNPTAEQLSEIAIQSADSAKAFGIEPRVAMISYSTGNSGTGSAVEKVHKAASLAQKRRPDLIIDGPLQYDAAIVKDVAKFKAPNSPVAGKANVFIFPDLNTGNTTYKAVQRSANLVSIGPMLQGIRKPVNDLSRGALIDDIVYTIAITAIQAAQNNGQLK